MKTIDGFVLKRRIEQLGFQCLSVLDGQLFLPSEDWLKKFTVHLRSYYEDALPNPAPNYFAATTVSEARDCDDYSLLALAQSRIANAHRKAANEGIAFGACRIVIHSDRFNGIPGRAVHITNITMLDDEQIYAYEPQTGLYTAMPDAASILPFFTPSWALI